MAKAKKRYSIYILEINQFERHKSFEIKLPGNVRKVSGVIITSSLTSNNMGRLGTLTLQSMDECDVFLKEDLFLNGITDPREYLINLYDPSFDEDKEWISGQVPGVIPVLVDGDTSIIYGWFKGDIFYTSYIIKIYIEYEEQDQVENDREPDSTTDTGTH